MKTVTAMPVPGARKAVPGCLLLVLALGLSGCGQPARPVKDRVEVAATVYQGVASDDGAVAAFLGIPFAEPPVGELRWMPPVVPGHSSSTLQAGAFAPACMQGAHMVDWYRDLVRRFGGDPDAFPVPTFSEDCLYLNIWTPRPEAGAGLPVMVWIHGGGHRGGWSYEPNYIGDELARQGVVVVSIAYRLDVFGFFSHPDLDQSNFGLLDQIAALRWVQDNIGRFGGNPGNVTVFGESAGGASIAYLMASPRAQGLFQRAIQQSAGYQLLTLDRREDFLDEGVALQARLLGDAAGDIDALRRVPAGDLLGAVAEVYADYQPDVVVDGHSVPERVLDAFLGGRVSRVELLTGSNADEWRMYLDQQTTQADVAAWIAENAPMRAQALQAGVADTALPLHKLDRLYTAQQFVCPSLLMAELASKAGKAAYVYYFSRQRAGAGGDALGAYHGAEIPYLFDKHDDWLPTEMLDHAIGRQMQRYWVNFASSGNPNFDGGVAWPRFVVGSPLTLRIGDSIEPMIHPEAGLCAGMASLAN